MAEYKETHGSKIKNYDTDPDNPYVGQLWYNEELGTLRVYATTLNTAWSTSGSINTARLYLGGAGTQTATLAFGGQPGAALTELYNGSNWTEVADLNTGRRSDGGAGT